MKRSLTTLFVFGILFLSACSDDAATPNERFEEYIATWEAGNYEELYNYLSTTAKEQFAEEESTMRTADIYGALEAGNLAISMEALEEDALDTAMEEGTATIPFTVSMDTLAGEISFSHEATLTEETVEEEQETWFVDWQPSYIFPQLTADGEARINTTDPKRGEILDRNQMPLAINDTIYEIGVVPGELGGNRDAAINQLSGLLGMSTDAINEQLNAGWVEDNLFVPLKDVSPTDTATVNELMTIPGVQQRESTGRVYPLGEAAGHLTGYMRQVTAEDLEELDSGQYSATDMIGYRGLEGLHEETLRGTQGVSVTVENPEEDPIALAEIPVENGKNIHVTIDVNTQQKIHEAYQGDAGTSAAIDAKTGETLALVSSPAYDPNAILYDTSGNVWETLQSNELQPLTNRFAATYAPGSVLKPVTGAIGLANGSIKLGEGMEINGLTWKNGESWGDYAVTRVSTSNGPVDLEDALIRSDNIYFAQKAIEMGTDALAEGLKAFGVGEELPLAYPITTSTISASGELDGEILLANTAYGQGEIEMSSLHLATTFTTFLNDGNMLSPTIMMEEEKEQIWKENLLTADNAQAIQDHLRKVVTDGTGAKAQESAFPISGKTGTVELKLTQEGSGAENGWFVGYPTDSKDIIIAMMIENTHEKESGLATKRTTEVLNEIK